MAQPPNPTSTQGGSLTRRERPYHPLDLFRHEMESLFDRFFGAGWLRWQRSLVRRGAGGFDVDKTDQEIVVRADVPGFEENELDVRLDNDVLTIKAEKEQEGGDRREYRSFFRRVALPPGVEAEKVQASYRSGVLELHIPRPASSQAKQIPIRSQPAEVGPARKPSPASQMRMKGNGPPTAEQAGTQTPRKETACAKFHLGTSPQRRFSQCVTSRCRSSP